MSERMHNRDRVEELTRRPPYVYNLPEDILDTLHPASGTSEWLIEETSTGIPAEPVSASQQASDPPSPEVTACSLCQIACATVAEQRRHARSDVHRYNLKRRVRGLEAVGEDAFEKLVGDLDESLSGSDDSETDEEQDSADRTSSMLSALLKKQTLNTDPADHYSGNSVDHETRKASKRQPIVWFSASTLPKLTRLGFYRAIFTNAEQEHASNLVDILRQKQIFKSITPANVQRSEGPEASTASIPPPHIFMCMIGGGHFAAMVVSLNTKQQSSAAPRPFAQDVVVLARKTFHRYTTRRKQGGSQSANDSAKGAAHSAGAGIRRYNEAALNDEVRALLAEWRTMIDTSELLFVRATGSTSRRTLYGPYEHQVLSSADPRIRGFPFSTRRPTENELLRSFVELTRAKVVVMVEQPASLVKPPDRTKATSPANLKERSIEREKQAEQQNVDLLHTSQIQALVRRSKLPALLSYLKANDLSPDFYFVPRDSQQNYHSPTPLHLAASLHAGPIVLGLLVRAGASPLLPNGDGKFPYDLAGDRNTRDAFRVARGALGEDTLDWANAHVPVAMTAEEASGRQKAHEQQEKQKEEERRETESERLKLDDSGTIDTSTLSKGVARRRALLFDQMQKTAQENREEELKGLGPEMKKKLEREVRARAAEERMRKLANNK